MSEHSNQIQNTNTQETAKSNTALQSPSNDESLALKELKPITDSSIIGDVKSISRAITRGRVADPSLSMGNSAVKVGQLQTKAVQGKAIQKKEDILRKVPGNFSKHVKLSTGETIRPKLKVGSPNSRLEQEADNVADQVMSMPVNKIQRMGNPEEEELQSKPIIQRMEEEELQEKPIIQRMEEEELQEKPIIQRMEEEELQEKPIIQRKEADSSADTGSASPATESSINSLRNSGGAPLAESERSFFEPRFGRDFSDVRIHTGPQAEQVSREVNARAFTLGNDVFFGTNEYSPGTESGQKLIAHELTHTVQQGGGKGNFSNNIQRKFGDDLKPDSFEYFNTFLSPYIQTVNTIIKHPHEKKVKFDKTFTPKEESTLLGYYTFWSSYKGAAKDPGSASYVNNLTRIEIRAYKKSDWIEFLKGYSSTASGFKGNAHLTLFMSLALAHESIQAPGWRGVYKRESYQKPEHIDELTHAMAKSGEDINLRGNKYVDKLAPFKREDFFRRYTLKYFKTLFLNKEKKKFSATRAGTGLASEFNSLGHSPHDLLGMMSGIINGTILAIDSVFKKERNPRTTEIDQSKYENAIQQILDASLMIQAILKQTEKSETFEKAMIQTIVDAAIGAAIAASIVSLGTLAAVATAAVSVATDAGLEGVKYIVDKVNKGSDLNSGIIQESYYLMLDKMKKEGAIHPELSSKLKTKIRISGA